LWTRTWRKKRKKTLTEESRPRSEKKKQKKADSPPLRPEGKQRKEEKRPVDVDRKRKRVRQGRGDQRAKKKLQRIDSSLSTQKEGAGQLQKDLSHRAQQPGESIFRGGKRKKED